MDIDNAIEEFLFTLRDAFSRKRPNHGQQLINQYFMIRLC